MARVWTAASSDATRVARLLGEFRDWLGYAEPSDESLTRDVELLIDDPNTVYVLAAADGDEPAGVCQVRFRYGVWLSAEDCWLEDLYVREDARRAGLGRALIDAAAELAAARGCRRVELDVSESNPAAIALYESLGFSAWAEPPGARNLLMRRRLAG